MDAMPDLPPRAIAWAETMAGHPGGRLVRAHEQPGRRLELARPVLREQREEREAAELRPGAALAVGSGQRAIREEADAERTCFERDRDRIVHSAAFRRLAGKTQVVVFPNDHQRTRLTHALEVAQVATSIARGVGANATLAEAIALGHDCGHGPGGHASEDAFDAFLAEGYDHGPWGADVVLTNLNLCAETLDGIRNHSWSRPVPATVEGEVVSWADRIAYCAHDLEDAVAAGIVRVEDLPADVVDVAGRTRRQQLGTFVRAVIATVAETGSVGMAPEAAAALASLRAFNYERIYTRPDSLAQSEAVVAVLHALVEYYAEHPLTLPSTFVAPDQAHEGRVRAAVTYVAGMTDRFAFETAVELLGWDADRLPKGIGRGA
jgi:dGTPase